MKKRYDLINHLIKTNNYQSYLEIGVSKGNTFRRIECLTKHSVDPIYTATFKTTSDQFFATNQAKYDLVFIDGLHTEAQVRRDIHNALKVLNEGGTIVIHDCNPATEARQAPTPPTSGAWNGDGWKVIYELRQRSDLVIYTVDTDYGIAVVRQEQNNQPIAINNKATWDLLVKHRTEILNLISVAEFLTKETK